VVPSLRQAYPTSPSPVLWATPTPAPLSPTSRLLTAYRACPGGGRGSDSPSPPLGWLPVGLTAGEETGLSCSHDGYPSVPRPLRHRVLRCCISKFFTPSMAFAHGHQARLPVGPFRGKSLRRGRLRFMLRTRGLHSPIGLCGAPHNPIYVQCLIMCSRVLLYVGEGREQEWATPHN